ncbi:hypothetical protein, partial [Rudaea sp.]|uniref:LptM family lipoprotein n=1 Tax=Rudaea sp. TaxID=2136325 RepID=UPI002ED691B0
MTVSTTRRIAILTLILLAAMLTGCGASGPAYKRMDPPMNGQGIVYIYRQPGHIGMGVHGVVRANGKAVTDIKNGGYFPYVGMPGPVK